MRRAAAVLALCALLAPPRAGAARVQTTTYSYNADGALTAATTMVDAGPPATTYVTWATFTPQAGNPTAGSVSCADGTLVAIGPRPGSAAARRRFAFDQRDRLTGSAAGAAGAAYAYHPASPLASSVVAGGDAPPPACRAIRPRSCCASATRAAIRSTAAIRWA